MLKLEEKNLCNFNLFDLANNLADFIINTQRAYTKSEPSKRLLAIKQSIKLPTTGQEREEILSDIAKLKEMALELLKGVERLRG